MDAHGIDAAEKVSASRKLGRDDAAALLKGQRRLVVAKGKKVSEFKLPARGNAPDEAVDAMLGPTGNLRAPTIRVGDTIVVGYHEATFDELLG